MDDAVPKPPVKPAKAAARRAKAGVKTGSPLVAPAVPSPPPAPVAAPATKAPATKIKPTGRKPAPPAAKPAPVAIAAVPAASTPAVPPVLAAVPAAPAAAVESVPGWPVPAAAPSSELQPVVPVSLIPAPAPQASAPTTTHAAKEVIMETIENITDKTQTAFADATAHAKTAVEKGQKLFEDANEFGKGNIEALVESSKIAVRGFEALGQDAAAYAKKSFEDATTAAKTLTSVKSPTEFLKLQSDYARSAFDGMVQQTSRNTEALLKLAGEVAQPLSNRVALAAEKMKVVAA